MQETSVDTNFLREAKDADTTDVRILAAEELVDKMSPRKEIAKYYKTYYS